MLVLLMSCVESVKESGADPVCEQPVSGFNRLNLETTARGIDHQSGTWTDSFPGVMGGEVGLEDLDGDGDIDITLGTATFPAIYENDGLGHFQKAAGVEVVDHGMFATHVLTDLNGDRLPEILLLQPGYILAFENLGGLVFGAPLTLWSSPLPFGRTSALSFGDLDGDGDLDAILPQIELMTEECQLYQNCTEYPPVEAAPHLILTNKGGLTEAGFVTSHSLVPAGGSGISTVGLLTDRDNDRDLDVLVVSERGFHTTDDFPPNAFFENQGVEAGQVVLTDNATELGAALVMSGMGVATTDFNEDGFFDYCITDTGPTRCLASDGDGRFYEATAVLGLVTENIASDQVWSAWSIEMLDFDNDGLLDAAVAAGQPLGPATTDGAVFRDAIWQGVATVEGLIFEERSIELGYMDEQNNFGLGAADLNGDGYLEIVVNTSFGTPQLWQNQCGADNWLEVDLLGPSENRFGIGATVVVETATHRYMQEVQSARALGQSPARLHFGLGAVSEATVTVHWPDGQSDTITTEGREVLKIEAP